MRKLILLILTIVYVIYSITLDNDKFFIMAAVFFVGFLIFGKLDDLHDKT